MLGTDLKVEVLKLCLNAILLVVDLAILTLRRLASSVRRGREFGVLQGLKVRRNRVGGVMLGRVKVCFTVPIAVNMVKFMMFVCGCCRVFRARVDSCINSGVFVLGVVVKVILVVVMCMDCFLKACCAFGEGVGG